MGIAFIPTAAGARLDEDGLKGLGADVMLGGPPGLHLLDKDGKGAIYGYPDAHAFTNDGFFRGL